MTTAPESPASPAPKSLVARFFGVIVAPQDTFRSIVAHPKALGMLALIIVLMAGGMFTFLSTETGMNALIDQQITTRESLGAQMSDAQIEQIEGMGNVFKYSTVIGQAVFIPIWYLVVAGILFAVFNAGMGGNATFKQVFTLVVHTGVIGVVQQAFVLPLSYVRASMRSATNLAGLLPMLPEKGFITYLLSTIDIFIIWSVIVTAIGLAVLYKRRTQPIAITLFSIYGVIALIIATVRTFMGGS